MTPLARRVLTAAVLVPLVVAMVLALPTVLFAAAFGIFAVLGALEWPRIARLRGAWRSGFWAGGALLAGILVWQWRSAPLWGGLLLLSMVFWLLALVGVIQAQHGSGPSALECTAARLGAGWMTLLPCWVACVMLHAIAPVLVLALLVLIWIADSAAFFAGRQFGRRRLASRVSPGKSWEGVLAGLVAVAIAAAAAQSLQLLSVNAPAALVALSLAVGAFSVVGDLAESLFKRFSGVKDSGRLIPGHGGVLDRIDSLTAAAPAFTAGWLILGLELS